MTDYDAQHAANAKALADMHPGNRFRLMAGLPLLEDEVVTAREKRFQQLPEWVRDEYNRSPIINSSVRSWLGMDMPASEFIERLAKHLMNHLNHAQSELQKIVKDAVYPPVVKASPIKEQGDL